MLISEKHRFIFIHIYRNAGTSITSALMPFAAGRWRRGPGAILRKIGLSGVDPRPYPSHIKAAELIHEMGRERFQSYFSFAIVRNPWDWQVSLYTYMLKNERHRQHQFIKSLDNFGEYIEWRCSEEVRYQRDFVLSGEGEQLVDFIGRYENLDQDFQYVCSRLGISATLPRLNVSRTGRYQEYYNARTIELVRRAFAPDVRLFGYHFEAPDRPGPGQVD